MMEKVLFVNCCIRGEKSRTLELCRDYLEKLKKAWPEWEVTEVDLNREELRPLDQAALFHRDALVKEKKFDDPMFTYTRQLMEADHIVIGAPYWDLAFPSRLKVYLEYCSVTGLTFVYNQYGIPEGQCRARSLTYITSSGGKIGELNFGYDYIKGICLLFGIPRTFFASAEELDIVGNDVAKLVDAAKEKITEIVKEL